MSNAPLQLLARRLPPSLRPHAAALAAAAVAALAVGVAAWLIPIPVGHNGARAEGLDRLAAAPPAVPPAEDLEAFFDSRRWGGESLRETDLRIAAEQRSAEEEAREPPPADAPRRSGIDYVGMLADARDTTVLLTLPDGTLLRLRLGDALPDGRTVAEVSGNRLLLRGARGGEEMLALFPPLAATAPAAP